MSITTAAELEQRILDGDTTITAKQLADTRNAEHHAGLRREADRRQAVRDQAQAHLDACTSLREEIEVGRTNSLAELRQLLAGVDAAVRAFVTAADQHNTQLTGWRNRAARLGVPAHTAMDGRPPAAVHGGLGFTSHGEILTGPHRTSPIDITRWIHLVLVEVTPATQPGSLVQTGHRKPMRKHPDGTTTAVPLPDALTAAITT